MIESIEFKNFKVLRDAKLPLSPCTVLIGPNGTGKSTVLQALQAIREPGPVDISAIQSFVPLGEEVEVCVDFGAPYRGVHFFTKWSRTKGKSAGSKFSLGVEECPQNPVLQNEVRGNRVFALDGCAIARPATVAPSIQLGENGANLAAVLDDIRDTDPERFTAINCALGQWLPEFKAILFAKPQQGSKSVMLQTRKEGLNVPAHDLSQGTLIALAMLTLAYLPKPPSLIGIEEPDRGVHPRLLRLVQDAIYLLCYPESCGEKREPVQVIVTTHSPYFLDLFKDHPEEIVIANRVGMEAKFERLSDRPDMQEILSGASLGEIWYSGILRGVPDESGVPSEP
jgi:predicted ATPase